MRLLNITWSYLRFNVWRSFVTMAINLPSRFLIQFLEQLLKFLVNFTLLKYVKSQRSYGFQITKELIFGFQILDLKDYFSASLSCLKATFHLTISTRGQRASGKIQRNNYHHGSCGPSLKVKRSRCFWSSRKGRIGMSKIVESE